MSIGSPPSATGEAALCVLSPVGPNLESVKLAGGRCLLVAGANRCRGVPTPTRAAVGRGIG